MKPSTARVQPPVRDLPSELMLKIMVSPELCAMMRSFPVDAGPDDYRRFRVALAAHQIASVVDPVAFCGGDTIEVPPMWVIDNVASRMRRPCDVIDFRTARNLRILDRGSRGCSHPFAHLLPGPYAKEGAK